jgi:hypothetical protein
VITKFRDCWSSLRITHLVIGEGADGTDLGLDLELAKEIIHAATETLVYVITTSNDLQTHLLQNGWSVSIEYKDPVISSQTGEEVFFTQMYRASRRGYSRRGEHAASSSPEECSGLASLRERLSFSEMRSNAELLEVLEAARGNTTPSRSVHEAATGEPVGAPGATTATAIPLEGDDDDSGVREGAVQTDSAKRKDTQAASPSSGKKPRLSAESSTSSDEPRGVITNLLNITWGMVLSGKYFDEGAFQAGFAKPVAMSQLINVCETLFFFFFFLLIV